MDGMPTVKKSAVVSWLLFPFIKLLLVLNFKNKRKGKNVAGNHLTYFNEIITKGKQNLSLFSIKIFIKNKM